MKITYSQIEVEFRQEIEKEAQRHVDKLNRLLKRYAPDSVILHGSLEKTPRKTEYSFSANLTLPTGRLRATGIGSDVRISTKAAFAELELQVKRHQEKLRKDYVWKRKRSLVRPGETPTHRGEAAD
jgi:ribosome-associated translation inhibitor RaiA